VPSTIELATQRTGEGRRVVLVHGFTQTGASWRTLSADLARDHEVVTVDAPGHGRSVDVHADLVTTGRLLVDVGGPAAYVGYSMGGRMCLHAAVADPASVRGLVVVGATGGIDDEGERTARRDADDALADHLVEIGLDAFLDEWLAQPIFAGLDEAAADRPSRLDNTTSGLASSLRLAGTGTQRLLWDRLHVVHCPVLVVAGERDIKFRAAGERLVAAIGTNAELAVIEGAGHAAHAERPEVFGRLLRSWLHTHEL
jgi:2-succinyl-6-hydroxy-2,4-cyclohexadiene-1-carboxylate synthase